MSVEQALLEAADQACLSADVFFICSLRGPSGGLFLYTLLEGHPEAYAYPFKLTNVLRPGELEGKTKADVVELVLSREMLFDTARYGVDLAGLGDDRQQSVVVDRERFRTYLTAILDRHELTFRNALLAIAIAHNFVLGIVPKAGRFFFYVHQLETANTYREAMGTGRVIAMHRHPINLYLSGVRYTRERSIGPRWLKNAKRSGTPFREAALRKKVVMPYRLGNLFDFYDTLTRHGAEVGVVLLERLHAEPEPSLRLLAEYMGISWSPTLLQSTIHGLAWWGKGSAKLNGFSPDLHRRVNVDGVGPAGAATIEVCTANLHKHLGYQQGGGRWFTALGIDRVALSYFRDVGQVVREIALDRSLELGLRDRATICWQNLRNAALFPAQRLADVVAIKRRDRSMRAAQLRIVNPFHRGTEYFTAGNSNEARS